MSSFLSRVNHLLPFDKTERIIIGIVLALHALFFIGFHNSMKPNADESLDDSRVMANLVSPEAAKQPQAVPTPPPPKPKQEQKKKPVDEKSTQAPAQNQQQSPAPPTPSMPQQSKNESVLPNATVAPSTNSGVGGTPIQTDIGKLVVVYQPDADAYYPSFSKRSGEQGEVVVRLIIDETGIVEEVALLRSSSFPRLDRAATEIGRRYRFKPFLVNGTPNRISTNLLIKFNLKN
jgi:protein TonB